MTDSMRDRIERELGKDRLHELDKPVFGGRQLSDKQIEEIADALLEAFPWLADEPTDAEVEAGARALYEATYSHGIPPRPWSNISQDWETQYKRKTRAVLSAALGKEQSE